MLFLSGFVFGLCLFNLVFCFKHRKFRTGLLFYPFKVQGVRWYRYFFCVDCKYPVV